MKILIINETLNGSHGKIVASIAQEYEKEGHIVKIAYGRNNVVPENVKKYAYRIGNDFDVRKHALFTRLTDRTGFASKHSTRSFLKWANNYNPDLVWLHNLHGYYINIKLLFNWLKDRKVEVKWTLHDCWAFTGHCSHFTYVNCEKWKTGCYKCPQHNRYPKSFIDSSKWNYSQKKELFTGLKNLEVITPSNWLANLVKKSFLGEYKIRTIPNTVDKNIFQHRESGFLKRYKLDGKISLLSVASVWDSRKGLEDLIELSKIIDKRFCMIIIGLNHKQEKLFGPNVIKIRRTENQIELAEIYSACDFLINPSYEETFGMTVLEAQLCDCFPIIYENTASVELLEKAKGIAVKPGANNIYKKIIELVEHKKS